MGVGVGGLGSGQVRKATALAKSRDPKLLIEGPVQVLLHALQAG